MSIASYPLRGCVPDAQLVEKYLVENLGVPRNRIQLLLGSKEYTSPEDPMYPSRAHVVGALLSLITNPEITPGDNIIIYYSGHGSYYPPHTEEDGHTDYTETLCPIDRDTPGEDGKPVPDISDRELNTILSLISRTKGQSNHSHPWLLSLRWCLSKPTRARSAYFSAQWRARAIVTCSLSGRIIWCISQAIAPF